METAAVNHVYRFGEFTLDAEQRVLLRHGKPLALPPKVFGTLLILVENSGRIVEKDELMRRLWPDTFVEEANLTSNIQQLRKALGDDARHPIWIETVARRGYRFIAPVSTDEPPPPVEAGTNGANLLSPETRAATTEAEAREAHRGASTDALTRPTRWWARAALGVLAVLAVALGGRLLWKRSSMSHEASGGKVMLAVLPFQNLTGDAGQDYFSDGLTEEMIAQLGSLDPQHLGVIARTSVMRYKHSQDDLGRIGQELGIQYALEGSVRRDSDKVRITAQLIQISDQTHIWSRQYDRDLSGLLPLQGEIAREIADEIELTLGSHQAALPARPTPRSPQTYEAYDLYLKGQYFWNKRSVEGFQQAIDYFQRAADADPTYARAYVGLADSYALLGGYSSRPQAEFMRQARAAALRALELDEGSAEGHTALALVVQNYDWDWQTAEREFRRAIELNPNYATAHHWYAEHLMWRGRFDEALGESERARQLDPLSLIIAADRGAIFYYARQYDRAIEQFRAVRELDPNFSRAGLIDMAYVQKGQFADVLAKLEKQRPERDRPDTAWYWSRQAYLYGRMGQRAAAQHALEELEKLNRRQEVDASAFVSAYVGLGDKEQAFAWLEKAYAQHSNLITSLKVDPVLDPLRDDPRFRDLLHRVGLD